MKIDNRSAVPILRTPQYYQWLEGEHIINPANSIFASKVELKNAQILQKVIKEESGKVLKFKAWRTIQYLIPVL